MSKEFKEQCNFIRGIIENVPSQPNYGESSNLILKYDYSTVGFSNPYVPCFNKHLEFEELHISDFIACIDSYILSDDTEVDAYRKEIVKSNYLFMLSRSL